ncbi:MAG: hypothetical protein AB1656_24300 [Candidatus Omnitrophota bacterium]
MSEETIVSIQLRHIDPSLVAKLQNLSKTYGVSEKMLVDIAIKKFLNLALDEHCELIAEYQTCQKLGQRFGDIDLLGALNRKRFKTA